jgi:hypothetical protein
MLRQDRTDELNGRRRIRLIVGNFEVHRRAANATLTVCELLIHAERRGFGLTDRRGCA